MPVLEPCEATDIYSNTNAFPSTQQVTECTANGQEICAKPLSSKDESVSRWLWKNSAAKLAVNPGTLRALASMYFLWSCILNFCFLSCFFLSLKQCEGNQGTFCQNPRQEISFVKEQIWSFQNQRERQIHSQILNKFRDF